MYNWLPFTASLEVEFTSPLATLVILLPSTDKLPPVIVTAGVVALGVSFNVIVVLPFLIVLIPLSFLDN